MPKEVEGFDAIVVGAGIAGCVFAFYLANANFNVLVIEKRQKEELGVNWADLIEKKAFVESGIAPPSKNEKKNERRSLVILSPDLKYSVELSHYDYWIVDRTLFHQRLLSQAERAGVKFIFGEEVVEPIGKGMWVIGVKTKSGTIYKGKLTVDASGKERILGMNIEVLDLNYPLTDNDLANAYREIHSVDPKVKLFWGDHEIKKELLYYRYGYQGGHSWLNYEDKETIDIGAEVKVSKSVRKPKNIVNEYVNSNKGIHRDAQKKGGGKVLVRRPITMVWYGLMIIGDAACQPIPTNGCGVGSAMVAAKMAAEVAIDALRVKEVSINKLWRYQVRFIQERGKDYAALDMMRRTLQSFSEKEISLMMERDIISKQILEDIIHGKFPKIGLIKMFITTLKNLKYIRLLWKLSKGYRMAKEIYNHYRKIPKEYHTQKYHQWLLKQLFLFRQLEQMEG